jgi:hypothetical protein
MRVTNDVEKIVKDDGPTFVERMKAGLKAKNPNLGSLFAVPIKPKGYDQQIVYFPAKGEEPAGVYRVDEDGMKVIGAKAIPPSSLATLF